MVEAADPSGRRTDARQSSEVGRGLAAAAGFRVVTTNGADIGRVDHVRYQRRTDYPDEIVIRPSRFFRWRRQVIQFSQVERVEARTRTVIVKPHGD